MICSNCFTEINPNEEHVLSIMSGSPMHKDCANQCVKCGAYITDEESLKNKFKCNECTEIKTLHIDHVRRSHIETYKKCPYEFYLEVVKGVEKENNAYALHGIILHEIFEKYSLDNKLNKNNMYAEFKERYLKEVPQTNYSFKEKPHIYEELLKKGITAIDNFIEYEKTAMPPFKTEMQIIFPIAGDMPKVSITMDRIEKTERGLKFIDYKCGKTFAGQKLSTDLQVPLYCLASKYEFGELPYAFEFLFLSEGKTRLFELYGDNTYKCTVGKRVYEVQLTEAIREVKGIFSMIQKEQFNVTKNVTDWYCENMCYYKRNEACAGKLKQMWLGK